MNQETVTEEQGAGEQRRRSGSWASGRKLTPAQRARKRAVDRLSHRQKIQQTRQYISLLERKLGSSSAAKIAGPQYAQTTSAALPSGPHDDLTDTSIADCCNAILAQVPLARKSDICHDDRINCDMIIRAVVKGWDAVPQRGNFCPLWAILRYLDDLLFSSCSMIGRLVMLRMIHCMLFVSLNLDSFVGHGRS